MAQPNGMIDESGDGIPVTPEAPAQGSEQSPEEAPQGSTAPEPTPEAPAGKSAPSERNRIGELERRLANAEQRAQASEQAREQELTTLRENLAKAITGRGDDVAPSVPQAPDVFQDQSQYDTWVERTSRSNAEGIVEQKLEEFKAQQEAESRNRARAERTNRAVEEFKASRDWLADEDENLRFGEFVNRHIAPTGEDYSLTTEDLANAELLYRKDEILRDRASEGRSQAIRGVINNQFREPAARVSGTPFGEQTPAEQAETILSSDSETSARLMQDLPVESQMRILELIDPEVQPQR